MTQISADIFKTTLRLIRLRRNRIASRTGFKGEGEAPWRFFAIFARVHFDQDQDHDHDQD